MSACCNLRKKRRRRWPWGTASSSSLPWRPLGSMTPGRQLPTLGRGTQAPWGSEICWGHLRDTNLLYLDLSLFYMADRKTQMFLCELCFPASEGHHRLWEGGLETSLPWSSLLVAGKDVTGLPPCLPAQVALAPCLPTQQRFFFSGTVPTVRSTNRPQRSLTCGPCRRSWWSTSNVSPIIDTGGISLIQSWSSQSGGSLGCSGVLGKIKNQADHLGTDRQSVLPPKTFLH